MPLVFRNVQQHSGNPGPCRCFAPLCGPYLPTPEPGRKSRSGYSARCSLSCVGPKLAACTCPFANPRHAHEYKVFQHQPLAKDQMLVAGVIDMVTNYIEHPEVV